MKLYFETKPNVNGQKIQLVIDTETGKIQKGFFLFGWSVDAVKIEKKQLEKLFEQAFEEYYKKQKKEA